MKSLSVGESRFSLIGKSVAAQFLINQARKLLWRKVLLRWGQRKVCLSEGQPTLVMFHLFIVGATSILSELIIQPLFKLSNCPLKQQPHILQLSAALGLAFSLFEEQEQALLAYCHFCSFWNFQKTLYTLHTETMLKTGYSIQHKIWSHWVYQIYKEGGVVTRFLTAWHYTGPTLRKNQTVLQSRGIINLPSIFFNQGVCINTIHKIPVLIDKVCILLVSFYFRDTGLYCLAWWHILFSATVCKMKNILQQIFPKLMKQQKTVRSL